MNIMETRELFDDLMEKLAEQEFQNRGFKSDFVYDIHKSYNTDAYKILDEMYNKFEYFESEIIKIGNGTPIPKRDQ